jgi:hypothetical protein
MADQFVAEAATYTTQNKRRTAMTSTGLEPEIPAIKRLKTYALDHTTTATGYKNFVLLKEI